MPTVPLQPSLAWGCLWEDPCCPQPRSQEVLPVAWLWWPMFHGHPGKPFLVLRHLSQIEFQSQPPPQDAPSWLLHRLGSACQLLPAGPPSALFWLVCVLTVRPHTIPILLALQGLHEPHLLQEAPRVSLFGQRSQQPQVEQPKPAFNLKPNWKVLCFHGSKCGTDRPQL